MRTMRSMFDKRGVVPAVVLALLLIAAWVGVRMYVPGMASGYVMIMWLMLLLVLATIMTIASVAGASSDAGWRGGAFFCYAVIADTCGVLIVVMSLATGVLPLWDALELYALVLAWLGFVAAATAIFARLGPGFAVALSTTLAMVTLAAPVALMPVVRALAGTPYQSQSVTAITYVCPTLSMLEAVRPTIVFAWSQMPVMYALTPLGQDVPMTLAPWHVALWVWGVPAVVLAVGMWARNRKLEARS